MSILPVSQVVDCQSKGKTGEEERQEPAIPHWVHVDLKQCMCTSQPHISNHYINLILFVLSISGWVESLPLADVILGQRRAKSGLGREKRKKESDKNAHILTVDTAALPSFSDTISLSSSPVYSESSSHSSSINFMLSFIIHEKFIYIQCFRKLIFLWLTLIF